MISRVNLVLFLWGLWPAASLRADSLSFHIGRIQGDTMPDVHEYARGHQNQLFAGERLQGNQVEAAYVFRSKPMGRFQSAWIFGLGHVSADLEDSYPGGKLKLERSSTFLQGGFRLQDEQWIPQLHLSLDLMNAIGLAGNVALISPVGREQWKEDFSYSRPGIFHLTARAAYALSPTLSVDTLLRMYHHSGPGLFVGVSYDISHL